MKISRKFRLASVVTVALLVMSLVVVSAAPQVSFQSTGASLNDKEYTATVTGVGAGEEVTIMIGNPATPTDIKYLNQKTAVTDFGASGFGAVFNIKFKSDTLVGEYNVLVGSTNSLAATESSITIEEEEEVPKITGIVVTPPTKLIYDYGSELDLTGLEVDVEYDIADAETYLITDDAFDEMFEITGYSATTVGEQDITVELIDTDFSDTFKVTVNAEVIPVTVTNVEFTAPIKNVYVVGEELDLTGAKIVVTYSDDSSAIIDGATLSAMVTGYDKDADNEILTITVTYDVENIFTFAVFVGKFGSTEPVNPHVGQTKQGITGRVLDRATGYPIVGATVTLALGATGTAATSTSASSTVTDENGYFFVVDPVPNASRKYLVSYYGYARIPYNTAATGSNRHTDITAVSTLASSVPVNYGNIYMNKSIMADLNGDGLINSADSLIVNNNFTVGTAQYPYDQSNPTIK